MTIAELPLTARDGFLALSILLIWITREFETRYGTRTTVFEFYDSRVGPCRSVLTVCSDLAFLMR